MLSWYDILLAQQERHKDLLREMEKERLIRHMLAGRGGRDRLYHRALLWLGRRLVTWGRRLQERYGATVPVATLRSANRTC